MFTIESLEGRSLSSGFIPSQLRHAYGFIAAAHEYGRAAEGQGVTIAIVDAYNDPTIRHDLIRYDARYRLRPADLTVINLGAGGNTGTQGNWSIEETLDVETIHALLPRARIVLVEAASPSFVDLAIAEEDAASIPGVDVISNSWGSYPDPSVDAGFNEAFTNPNIVYAAAAGDSSGPILWPAIAPGVISVGGTVLHESHGHYTQTPWLTYTSQPDVSMIGGPPGMEVFGTSGFGVPTWTGIWGTSLACPAFCSVVGAADGVRIAQGKSPLGTEQVLAGLDPDEMPNVPGFLSQFDRV